MSQGALYAKIAAQANVVDMEILIKEYTTPTDIYIISTYLENLVPTLLIDDDEVSFKITDGKRINDLYTYGTVYIFTGEEFKNYLKNNKISSFDDEEIQYIRDYVGKITINKFIDNKISEFEQELDLDDYIEHQIEEYEEWCLKVDYGYSTNLWWNPIALSAITNLFL
jgi:hypothetical protein